MKVKDGVSLVGVVWQMFASAILVEEVMDFHGYETVITSGTEGKHTDETSLHYRGRALDYRNRDIPLVRREGLVAQLQEKLGPQYQVVLKRDHIHTEFDPRVKGVV